MRSPVYQWRKAFRQNMAVNCSEMLLNSSWMEVLLLMKVADIRETGGPMLRKRTEEEERTVGV